MSLPRKSLRRPDAEWPFPVGALHQNLAEAYSDGCEGLGYFGRRAQQDVPEKTRWRPSINCTSDAACFRAVAYGSSALVVDGIVVWHVPVVRRGTPEYRPGNHYRQNQIPPSHQRL